MGVVQDIITLLEEIRDGSSGSNIGITGLDLKIQGLLDKLTAFQYLETEFSQAIGTSPSLIIGEESEALDREISIRNAGNHIAWLSNTSTPSTSSPWRLPPNFLFSGIEGMEAIYGVAEGETELGVSIKLRMAPAPPPPNNPIERINSSEFIYIYDQPWDFPQNYSVSLSDYFYDPDPTDTIIYQDMGFDEYLTGNTDVSYSFNSLSGLVSFTFTGYATGQLFFRAESSDGTFIDDGIVLQVEYAF